MLLVLFSAIPLLPPKVLGKKQNNSFVSKLSGKLFFLFLFWWGLKSKQSESSDIELVQLYQNLTQSSDSNTNVLNIACKKKEEKLKRTLKLKS